VVDTNIVFSALHDLKSNAGKLLICAIEGRVELMSSEYIKRELERNLKEKLDYSEEEFKETIKALPIKWIEDESYSKEMKKSEKLIKHERDIPILALALYLNCDVVSGDEHFHDVDYRDFKCWKLKELVEFIEQRNDL
jgi:predicted nucleic acid-binding protein